MQEVLKTLKGQGGAILWIEIYIYISYVIRFHQITAIGSFKEVVAKACHYAFKSQD